MAKTTTSSQLAQRVAFLRISFGIIWAFNAALKWQPAFLKTFLDEVTGAAEGQPSWLAPWFDWWHHFLSISPAFFSVSVALIETLIAVALILGLAKRFTYVAAIIFSLLVWAIPEGFGGPYTAESTDVGAGIIYAVVFFALYGLEQLAGESKLSVDGYIKRKLSWWRIISDF